MDESIIGNVLSGLINRDNDNWNGNGGWWIILLLLFFCGGTGMWGAHGYANPNVATQQDITNGFNFNGLDNDIRSVERGICSSGYENARLIDGQTIQMLNGFNNLNTGNMQQTMQLGSAINDVNNTVQMVGCTTNHNISDLKYEMAQNTCAITTNATANTQKILDRICQLESNAKDEKIAQLRTDLQAAQLTLAQGVQTQAIVGALKPPTPVPAYLSYNPYASYAGTTFA